MLQPIRNELREVIGLASALDGIVAEKEPADVPALEQARALVTVAKLKDQLAKLTDRLGRNGKPPRQRAAV